VVRFGGLIGEDRHPVKFLSGRKNVEQPDSPVNLIHQNDCIGILLTLIEKEIYGEVFNAVAPSHPTRKTYYTKRHFPLVCRYLNLPSKTPQENHFKRQNNRNAGYDF
jgi:NAD dependent epimerase/dehydratase family enzyme